MGIRSLYSVCLIVGALFSFIGQSFGDETRVSAGKATLANDKPKVSITAEPGSGAGGTGPSNSESVLIAPRRARDGKSTDRTAGADFGIKITPQPALPEVPRKSADQIPIVRGRRSDRDAGDAKSKDGGTGFFGSKGANQHSPGSFGQR